MTLDMQALRSGRRKGFGGGPKRTLKEMAEEFGVPVKTLASKLGHYNGPKSSLKQQSNFVTNAAWYDPAEMRTWWNALPEDVRKGTET